MGVAEFSERDWAGFGNFTRAFISIFRLAVGDSWVQVRRAPAAAPSNLFAAPSNAAAPS